MAFDIFSFFSGYPLVFFCFSFFLISEDFSGGEYKCYIYMWLIFVSPYFFLVFFCFVFFLISQDFSGEEYKCYI